MQVADRNANPARLCAIRLLATSKNQGPIDFPMPPVCENVTPGNELAENLSISAQNRCLDEPGFLLANLSLRRDNLTP
jgi:hypothetical protein